MSHAVEHTKAIKDSNKARLFELFSEIEAAGLAPQLQEYLYIVGSPEAAFTERLEKRRKERKAYVLPD